MSRPQALIFLLAAAGCALFPLRAQRDPSPPSPAPPTPTWTLDHHYPGCQGPDWLVTIGIGEGETAGQRHDRALNHAREQLAASIRIRVVSDWRERISSRSEERWGPQGHVRTQRLREVIDGSLHTHADEVLTGVALKDRHDDGRTAHVVCALHLPTTRERLRAEILELEARASAARAEAGAEEGPAGQVQRLGHLARALGAYGAAGARRQTLASLGGAPPPDEEEAIQGLCEAQDGIAVFASALRLERTGGHGLLGGFDAPLPERPALRLTLGDAPLAGCPVRFRFVDGEGSLDASPPRTDTAGQASCEVYRTARTGRWQHRIEAAVDLAAIAGEDADALASALGGPIHTEFTYYLPTPETTRIAFDIRETVITGDGGAPGPTHQAAGFLADRCRAEGFGLMAQGAGADRREGHGDLLCTGTVELRAQPAESFKYYLRARVNLELTDLASGKVLVRIDDRTLPYQPKGLSQTSYAHAAEQFFRQRGAFPLVAARLLLALHGEFIADQAALAERRRALEVWGGELP